MVCTKHPNKNCTINHNIGTHALHNPRSYAENKRAKNLFPDVFARVISASHNFSRKAWLKAGGTEEQISKIQNFIPIWENPETAEQRRKRIADLLESLRDSSLRDERGYTGPGSNTQERQPVDNSAWIYSETVIAVQAYAFQLRLHGYHEASVQLLRDASMKRAILESGGRTSAAGRDYDTLHYVTGQPVKLEIKSEDHPKLTQAQGFTAYENPDAYVLGVVKGDTVEFFDSKGCVVNRRTKIAYDYQIKTAVSMSEYYDEAA